MFDLSGATAVVTSVKSGIGFSMATALAAAGADIIGVSATIEAEGSAIEAEVSRLGRRFQAIRADIADPAGVRELGDRLADMTPDILVNNAGDIRSLASGENSVADWDEVVQMNLWSQLALTQQVAHGMLDRGRGKVIFTASPLSFQDGRNAWGYAAAKSGIAGLTRALATEWASHGVNVNAIAPGYIATDNTHTLEDPDLSRSILDRIPAGRWGNANDLGGATVFLASRASDYVSGVILPVDGGWLGYP